MGAEGPTLPLDDRLRSAGEVLTRLSLDHERGLAPRHPVPASSSRSLLWLAVAVATMVVAVVLTLVIPHRRSEHGPATTPPRTAAPATSLNPSTSLAG